MGDAFDDVSKSTKEYKDETDKVTDSSSNLKTQTDKTHSSTNKLKNQTDKTTESTKQYKEETDKATKHSKDYEEQTKDSTKQTEKLGDVSKETSSKMTGLTKFASTTAIAVGSAIVAVGGIAVNLANDMDSAVNTVISATGESVTESERYQKIIEDIYQNNYGESFEDIATSISKVKQQLGDIDDSELQNIVEKAYLMQDTFEIGVNESVRAVQSMMKQFGMDSETAFELMTQGAQKGLNQNEDLADQLSEYSVYYADLGYTAEEMFNALANGAKDGTYQIDYLNDAMKEFGLRSKDNSDTSKKAFEDLGLNADDMTKAFANGGDGAKKAFETVAKELKNVDDAVLQNEIGVALFGTKFEDLGADAVMALSNTNGAIDETKKKLDEVEKIKYNSLSDMFEELKRTVEGLLLPLGEKLIPVIASLIETISPIISDLLPPILTIIEKLMQPIAQLINAILPTLVTVISKISEGLTPFIQYVMPTILTLINALMPTIQSIIENILPTLFDVLNILAKPMTELVQKLLPTLNELFDAVIPCVEALMPVILLLAEILSFVLGNSLDSILPLIEGLIDVLINLMNFITAVFTGDWEKAWDSIVNIFKGIFNLLPTIIEGALNTAIGLINGLIGGVNELTGVIGITAIPNIPKVQLPRFKAGIDLIPYDDMPALLHQGEAVLTASEAEIYRSIGGKGSLEKMLSQNVSNTSINSYKTTSNVNTDSNSTKNTTVIVAKLELIIKLLKNQKQSITLDGRELTIAQKKYIEEELNFK